MCDQVFTSAVKEQKKLKILQSIYIPKSTETQCICVFSIVNWFRSKSWNFSAEDLISTDHMINMHRDCPLEVETYNCS